MKSTAARASIRALSLRAEPLVGRPMPLHADLLRVRARKPSSGTDRLRRRRARDATRVRAATRGIAAASTRFPEQPIHDGHPTPHRLRRRSPSPRSSCGTRGRSTTRRKSAPAPTDGRARPSAFRSADRRRSTRDARRSRARTAAAAPATPPRARRPGGRAGDSSHTDLFDVELNTVGGDIRNA